ncbi:MAG: PKD domain-containing protein, partial [Euryarchaeota archaeon]|nr:PKD domain-containing protein [Euryarchaeota archaeon]
MSPSTSAPCSTSDTTVRLSTAPLFGARRALAGAFVVLVVLLLALPVGAAASARGVAFSGGGAPAPRAHDAASQAAAVGPTSPARGGYVPTLGVARSIAQGLVPSGSAGAPGVVPNALAPSGGAVPPTVMSASTQNTPSGPSDVLGGSPQSLEFGATGWQGISAASSGWVPPDPSIAVGSTEVMQVVNDNWAIYSKTGTLLSGIGSLNTLIGTGNAKAGDPQIIYDNMTSRWFITLDDFTYGTTWIAISQTSDAIGFWWIYNFSIAPSGDYFDRPILGVSDYVIGIGGNVWTNGGAFVDAEWFVVNKTDIEAGGTYYWWYWTNAGLSAVHPAASWTNALVGAPGTQFFVCTTCGSGVLLIRETGGATSSPPSLSSTTIAHATFSGPPDALQPGAGAPYVSVALSGAQVMNAIWQKGALWLTVDIGCVPSGDSTTRDCVEYLEINTVTGTIANDVTVSANTDYAYYPEVASDWYGDVGVVTGYSNTGVYPSLTVMGRNYTYTANADEFWSYVVTGNAQDAYSGCTAAPSVCRYGDYFGAASDPTNPSAIWIEGEYMLSGVGNYGWSTYIASVLVNPQPIPYANFNQTSVALDLGRPVVLNMTDTDTQCSVSQTRFCSTSLEWGDGGSYSDVCDGFVGTWGGLNSWYNVWDLSHTYAATGNYTAGGPDSYITAFSSGLCSASVYQGAAVVPSLPITVNRDPVLGPSVPSTTSMDVGQTVTIPAPAMYGGTGGVKVRYYTPSSASFGCTVSGINVVCTPTAAGSYTVSWFALDSTNYRTPTVTTATVTVSTTPTATLAWSATAVDVGQTATVTATPSGGSGGNSYSWSQSSTNLGCTFANAVSVSCVPTTSGSYTASVDITDSNGGSSGTLTSPSLTVDPALSTSAPTPSKTAVDVGQPVTFSTTATGGSGTYTSYAWTPSGAGLGCASSTTSSITCTPTTSGSYTISVTVTDSNGWTSPSATSASFTVDPALTTSAPAPNKWSVDTGQPVSFSTTASGGSSSYSSYAWTPSGAGLGCTASTTATITCTPTSAGAYTISVKVTDSNGWTSPSATSASFTVFAAPTATTPSANRTSADIGQSITFSTTISGGSSGTTSVLSWSGLTTLGCASANATSITCVPTTGGSTTITVTVTDSNGGTSTSSALSYTVASDPATSTPTATPSTAETGQTVSFSTTPSGGSGTYNYYWSGLPTGCSTSNVDPLPCTPSAAGTSSVVVTVVDS